MTMSVPSVCLARSARARIIGRAAFRVGLTFFGVLVKTLLELAR
jgi:hypothetical protein